MSNKEDYMKLLIISLMISSSVFGQYMKHFKGYEYCLDGYDNSEFFLGSTQNHQKPMKLDCASQVAEVKIGQREYDMKARVWVGKPEVFELSDEKSQEVCAHLAKSLNKKSYSAILFNPHDNRVNISDSDFCN